MDFPDGLTSLERIEKIVLGYFDDKKMKRVRGLAEKVDFITAAIWIAAFPLLTVFLKSVGVPTERISEVVHTIVSLITHF